MKPYASPHRTQGTTQLGYLPSCGKLHSYSLCTPYLSDSKNLVVGIYSIKKTSQEPDHSTPESCVRRCSGLQLPVWSALTNVDPGEPQATRNVFIKFK